MNRTLAAEVRKLRYQRSTWWITIVAILFGILNTTSAVVSTEKLGSTIGLPGLMTEDGMRNVHANGMGSYIFALIVGIIISTGEFRHSTAVATYLAQPRRGVVMAAKMVVAAIAGFVIQFLSAVISMAAAEALLTQYEHARIGIEFYLRVLGVSVLSGVVLGVVGVALGQLIRNQVVAIVGSILWLFLVEALLITFAEEIGKFLPTGAIAGMLALTLEGPVITFGQDLFSPLVSTLILIGYGVLFAAIAARTTLRRDID